MMESEIFEINGVSYELRKANFFEARKMGFSLLSVLKGAMGADGGFDFGVILGNLNNKEVEDVQNFILKYATADGVKLTSSIEIEKHFNNHRDNYFPLMIEGLKYHFAGFFPNGSELVKNINISNLTANL